jgi:hypothetical protein
MQMYTIGTVFTYYLLMFHVYMWQSGGSARELGNDLISGGVSFPASCTGHIQKCGHALTGVNLKWISHRENVKCCQCEGTPEQTRGDLFSHSSRLRGRQKELRKKVGSVTSWKAGR